MNTLFTHPPVLGLAAYSGSGKTTLLSALLPLLEACNVRIGVIKHSHHDFEIDRPGKDSFVLRKAGARQMLIASPFRTVLINEHRPPREPHLEQLLEAMQRDALDLILVEGFRHVRFPKLEVHRAETGKPFLHTHDPSIIAVVCDHDAATSLPKLDINRPQQIVDFILDYISLTRTGQMA